MHAGTAAFACMALYSASRGQFFGAAAENFWNAYQPHTKDLDVWTAILWRRGLRYAPGEHRRPVSLAVLFYAVSAAQVVRDETNDPAG